MQPTHVLVCSTSCGRLQVLLRLCREMVELFGLAWDEEGLDEYQVVKESFFKTLADAGDAARKMRTYLVIIIDGINQVGWARVSFGCARWARLGCAG
jgi:hypothetical protein